MARVIKFLSARKNLFMRGKSNGLMTEDVSPPYPYALQTTYLIKYPPTFLPTLSCVPKGGVTKNKICVWPKDLCGQERFKPSNKVGKSIITV